MRILKCFDTSKQKEKKKRFGLMGFIGIEKRFHNKQHLMGDTPLSSLIDSITSPNVKTMKG